MNRLKPSEGNVAKFTLMNDTRAQNPNEKSNPAESSNRDDANVEFVNSDALVVYDEDEVQEQKRRFFGGLKRKSTPSREQLGKLLFENIEAFPEKEAQLLRAVFALTSRTTREVMVPLSEIVALTSASSSAEVRNLYHEFNYRYIPIYNERIDWLLGIISTVEVLATGQHFDELSPFVRDAYYVPEVKPAIELLEELRQSEMPVAIVINEHGSCVGFVELIDILEKIVGDIAGNKKREAPRVERLGKGAWRLDARASINDVNLELGTSIATNRCDTIGGFILMLLGRLPRTGEKVGYEGFEFNIEEVFDYGISSIRAVKHSISMPWKKRA